jgi:hypothetical protein
MQRIKASPTFTDAAVLDLNGPRTARFLRTCDELVPWNDRVAMSAAPRARSR